MNMSMTHFSSHITKASLKNDQLRGGYNGGNKAGGVFQPLLRGFFIGSLALLMLLSACGKSALPLQKADPLDALNQQDALLKSKEIPPAFPGDIPIFTKIVRVKDAGDFSLKGTTEESYINVVLWLEVKSVEDLLSAQKFYKNALKQSRYNAKFTEKETGQEGAPNFEMDAFASNNERVRVNLINNYLGVPVIRLDYFKK